MKPHTLHLGGHRIHVRLVKEIHDDQVNKEEVGLGRANTYSGLIRIATQPYKDFTPEGALQVYLHEAVHCIDQIFCGETLTEAQVDGVSQGLLQLLQQRSKWLR